MCHSLASFPATKTNEKIYYTRWRMQQIHPKIKNLKNKFQMSWFLVCLELSDEFWIDLPAGREWLGNPMWLLLFCTTSFTVHTHVHTNVHAQIFVFLLCSYTIASSLLQEEALMMTWQLIGTQQTQYLYPSNAIHMCQNILRLRCWWQHQHWCMYIGTGAGIQGKIL